MTKMNTAFHHHQHAYALANISKASRCCDSISSCNIRRRPTAL